MTPEEAFISIIISTFVIVMFGGIAMITGGFGLGKETDIDEDELTRSFDPRKQFDDEV